MSNAREMSKLINKFTPTASGVDLTGTFDVSGIATFDDRINAGANMA